MSKISLHTTTIDPDREETCKQAFAELCIVLQKHQIRTNELVELVNDLIINVALQVNNGDQVKAGEMLRDHYIPDIQSTVDELLANEVTTRDVDAVSLLAAFDISGKLQN